MSSDYISLSCFKKKRRIAKKKVRGFERKLRQFRDKTIASIKWYRYTLGEP